MLLTFSGHVYMSVSFPQSGMSFIPVDTYLLWSVYIQPRGWNSFRGMISFLSSTQEWDFIPRNEIREKQRKTHVNTFTRNEKAKNIIWACVSRYLKVIAHARNFDACSIVSNYNTQFFIPLHVNSAHIEYKSTISFPLFHSAYLCKRGLNDDENKSIGIDEGNA